MTTEKLNIEAVVEKVNFMQKQFVLVSENHVRTGGKQICDFRYKNRLGCMILRSISKRGREPTTHKHI